MHIYGYMCMTYSKHLFLEKYSVIFIVTCMGIISVVSRQ